MNTHADARRGALADDVAAFLAGGGAVKVLEAGSLVDANIAELARLEKNLAKVEDARHVKGRKGDKLRAKARHIDRKATGKAVIGLRTELARAGNNWGYTK